MVYEQHKVNVPEGTTSRWRIERFTMTREMAQFDALRSMFNGSRRYVPPGTYTRLVYLPSQEVMMSDTPDEIRDHLTFIHQASGRVLIHGLGLGMCLAAVARKPEVTHVTVVEKDPQIIELVGPYYQAMFGDKLTIIEGDAFTWPVPKGSFWDFVWHDIWLNICPDNLDGMKRLHRRFGRRCQWQGSWARKLCEHHAKREKNLGWRSCFA